jgi:hypothetical protein
MSLQILENGPGGWQKEALVACLGIFLAFIMLVAELLC